MRKYVPLVRLNAVKEKSLVYHGERLDSPEKAAGFIHSYLADADREYAVVCCMDAKLRPVSVEVVSIGSLQVCPLEPREVFKNAILCNAASFLLFHTHPSGDPEPSRADGKITERLREAGELLGIPMVDHIILGDGKFYSFREEKAEGISIFES